MKAAEDGVDGEPPAAVARGFAGSEYPGGFLSGQSSGQREEEVGDVSGVARDRPVVDAPSNLVEEMLTGLLPGGELGRARVEIRERAGEHDLRQRRICDHEPPVAMNAGGQVADWVVGLPGPLEVVGEASKAFEEHFADEPGAVAEQLIDGGR